MAQPSTTASASSSGKLRFDFLNLLVTQLQNQNPLEPLDNNEMASQLSQFAQLEQLESMNETFQRLLAATQVTQAATLVGKQISYYVDDISAPLKGRVGRVEFDDGEVRLMVGKDAIGFGDILSVEN
ncbi:MAG: hypothetical protein AMJ81_02435 [Phycisphaerae bacterium SM23_33]|nr:MAG: hypothetical protein AMJ81_02435 [Phycisphaerae bacterium SM23_33]